MNETKPQASFPEASSPPEPPEPSAKDLAAAMATTTEETAHFVAGPTKELRLMLVPDEDEAVIATG
jgi:hypothetical protein